MEIHCNTFPDIVEWGQKHIEIVHVLVFIAFRAAVLEKHFDYYAGAEKIDMSPIVYSTPEEDQRPGHSLK